MHTGTVLLLSVEVAVLAGFTVFWLTGFIHPSFFPPVVVVDGIEHGVMPTGSLFTGLLFGLAATIGTFVFTYRRLDKR